MLSSGSRAFKNFAKNFSRVRSMEAELQQEQAIRLEDFRASIVELPEPQTSNLTAVYAYFRNRNSGG